MYTLRKCAALLPLALVACKAPSVPSPSDGPRASMPTNQFEMANGCYAIQSVSSNNYALRQENGGYAFATEALASATPFFFKATDLGKYLFLAENGTFPAAGNGVVSVNEPDNAADWTVLMDSESFVIQSELSGLSMIEADDASLALAEQGGDFRFVPASGCMEFPELSANVDGPSFKGTRSDGTVAGFADVHVHWSATDFLGGAVHGLPFHRFGVEHAVDDCGGTHGPQGFADLVGGLMGEDFDGHDTSGYPEFVDWPGPKRITHEGMYYKWVERAWKSGLRIMVNDLVENRVLCQLVKGIDTANPLTQQGGPGLQCNEMQTVHDQVDFMHRLQDYIDAQNGGPGQGWMRLVGSPAEARQVIAEGKLAVVLGVEISHIFNCQLNYNLPAVSLPTGLLGGENPGEPESELSEALHAYGQDRFDDRLQETLGLADENSCTESGIKAQLDVLWDKGVRQLFPVHEFDNAFGGNGIFDGLILNFGNLLDTGRFWQTYDCPEQDYFYDAGAIMAESLAGLCELAGSPECTEGVSVLDPLLNPVTDLIGSLSLPVYGNNEQCNARWMTPLGNFMVEELMKKGIIIEVDHLELEMKSQLIEKAAGVSPAYPLVSTHGGHGGISTQQARDMLAGGGLIYPYKPTGEEFVEFVDKVRDVTPANYPYPFAVGYGADTNGLGAQAEPQETNIGYPFTLFRGRDWAGVLGEGIEVQPLTFQISQVPESGREFDINLEGQSHYGLVADFVEQIRISGGNDALRALYNSAETYLQMWERTLESSASLSSQ
ncbi:MAG: hypothetical protein OXT49_05710 [Gammaproteobacteria bacterium]|nr:hypothetical protein [Gammaproteobacteria bacterium]